MAAETTAIKIENLWRKQLGGRQRTGQGAPRNRGPRRALLATLEFAGPRIGEALASRWRDVDLPRGTITVRAGKTAAAARTVNILPALGDELRFHAVSAKHDQARLVSGTSTGGAHDRSQIRQRVLAKAIADANERPSTDEDGYPVEGVELIPPGITPHSLRPHVRVDPVRDRRAAALPDGATLAHHGRVDAVAVCPAAGPPRRRAGKVARTRGRPRSGRVSAE